MCLYTSGVLAAQWTWWQILIAWTIIPFSLTGALVLLCWAFGWGRWWH